MFKHNSIIIAALFLLVLVFAGCQPIVLEPDSEEAPNLSTEVLSADARLVDPTPSEEAPDLFIEVPSDDERLTDPRDDLTIVRTRYVELNGDILKSRIIDPSASSLRLQPVTLNLFDDVEVTLVTDSVEQVSAEITNMVGRVQDGEPGSAVLVLKDGNITGSVTVDDTHYQIRPAKNGLHSISEVDESAFPDDAEPVVPEYDALNEDEVSFDLPSNASPSDVLTVISIIDVLVVYTQDASVGSSNAGMDIEAEIALAIEETNMSFENSGVAAMLRLVHSEKLNYHDSGQMNLDLNRLKTRNDGIMDNVHTLRDQHGADLVSLWVEDGKDADGARLCGKAFLMGDVSSSFASNGFSVVARWCATGPSLTFGHELGHNMGACHEREAASLGCGAFIYSFGYQLPSQRKRSMMAYNDGCDCSDEVSPCPEIKDRKTPGSPYCSRTKNWSNPDTLINGEPFGIPVMNIYPPPPPPTYEECREACWNQKQGCLDGHEPYIVCQDEYMMCLEECEEPMPVPTETVPFPADNRRTLNTTAGVVALFRPASTPSGEDCREECENEHLHCVLMNDPPEGLNCQEEFQMCLEICDSFP